MSLESMLKPAKWLDERVLTQYTKIGKKYNLDKGKKKYVVGVGLWFNHVGLSMLSGIPLISGYEVIPRVILNSPDFGLNVTGILVGLNDHDISETKVSNSPMIDFFLKYNSIVRLPIFLAGAGLVTKFGVDVASSLIQGSPMDGDSVHYFAYGTGLLSLASSMYIKDTDPKLLDKDPFWKQGYNWLKEKASSLNPKPIPQPTPIQTNTTLDNYVTELPGSEKVLSYNKQV